MGTLAARVPVVRVRRDARQARRLLRAPVAATPRAVVKRGHRGARLAHVLARRFGVRKRAHARFPEFRVARVLPRHPELRGVQRQRGRVRQVDAVFREHRGSVVIAIAIVIATANVATEKIAKAIVIEIAAIAPRKTRKKKMKNQ